MNNDQNPHLTLHVISNHRFEFDFLIIEIYLEFGFWNLEFFPK